MSVEKEQNGKCHSSFAESRLTSRRRGGAAVPERIVVLSNFSLKLITQLISALVKPSATSLSSAGRVDMEVISERLHKVVENDGNTKLMCRQAGN